MDGLKIRQHPNCQRGTADVLAFTVSEVVEHLRVYLCPSTVAGIHTKLVLVGTVGHHLFDTMCPTAFLAPTLTAKTCFICTQPQNAFFLAQLALQGNRANGKKSLPGRVPGPKKGTKMVPKSGSFQEEFFLLSGQKKSQKLDRALP